MHCDDTGRVVWADGMAQDVTVGKQAGERCASASRCTRR
jgi:hypothetical protein